MAPEGDQGEAMRTDDGAEGEKECTEFANEGVVLVSFAKSDGEA
jgi:hypothetical protein